MDQHTLTIFRAHEPQELEDWRHFYGTPTVHQATCSCGWTSEVHSSSQWKHPDVRARSNAEQHLRHECETCTRFNTAKVIDGKPGYGHPLRDDVRYHCTEDHRPKFELEIVDFEKIVGAREVIHEVIAELNASHAKRAARWAKRHGYAA